MHSAIMHMHIITTYGVRNTNKTLVGLGQPVQVEPSLLFFYFWLGTEPLNFLQYGAQACGFTTMPSALS